jgi:integrase
MLLKRKNTYYFRWQIPKDLRPYFGYELIRSLRTTNKIEALAGMGSYAQIVNLIKETRRLMMLKELTHENYEEVLSLIKEKLLNTDLYPSLLGELVEQDALTIDWMRVCDKIHRDSLTAVLNELDLPVYSAPISNSMFRGDEYEKTKEKTYQLAAIIAKGQVSENGVLRNMKSEGYETQTPAILSKFKRDYTNLLIDDLSRRIDVWEGKTPIIEKHKKPIAQVVTAHEKAPVMLLSQFLADDFFEYKKSRIGGLSEKAETDYNTEFTKILALMEDKPLNLYTRKDIHECLGRALLLPAKIKSPYNKMSYEEILDLGEIPEEDLASLGTADHVRKKLQGIFNTAVILDFIAKTPADKLDWRPSTKSFGNYFNEEVKLLFETAQKEEEDWKKWLVCIGALTGCRLSEVIHLRGKDLIKDVSTGIYYFNITPEAGPLKTKSSSRRVPIHSKLIEIGLLDYRDSIGAEALFDVKDKAATAWYSRFRERCGVPYLNKDKERRVFHSFRHWVITFAREKVDNISLVQQVVGHAKINAGTTDRYTNDFSMRGLDSVIQCLDMNEPT